MNITTHNQSAADADVCLLLEGTYPYVRGGVSSWVKQLIDGMPELKFSIVYLGADRASMSEYVYDLPDNVVHIQTHALMEEVKTFDQARSSLLTQIRQFPGRVMKRRRLNDELLESNALHMSLKDQEGSSVAAITRAFTRLLVGESSLAEKDLEQHPQSWLSIREHYAQAPEGLDFNHYFWTVRSMHAPLFILAKIAKSAPPARLYHSVSTGYAGFLGALLQQSSAKPYVISEHGIYTKERELDLAQVDWIPETYDPFKVGLHDNMDYLRRVWISFFASLGRMAYSSAAQICTLYEGNRQRQIKDGADPEKLLIIPNGVDVQRFSATMRPDDAQIPKVLALIGRVVPIKDIKTYIRALHIIQASMPEVQGWIVGPEDEDPDYTNECKELVKNLGLSDTVIFKGFQRLDEVFPQIGLCVLTSVSEGQPLVVLEGYAAGIPSLTTDVGSCKELAYGNTDEDKALGKSGLVVPIADPSATADAAIRLLSDAETWRAASAVATKRVDAYYNQYDMIARYETIYREHMESCEVAVKPGNQAKAA